MSEVLPEIIGVLQGLQELSTEGVQRDATSVDPSEVIASFYDSPSDFLLHNVLIDRLKILSRDFSSFESLALIKRIKEIARKSKALQVTGSALQSQDPSSSNGTSSSSHPLTENEDYQALFSSLCSEIQTIICSSSCLSSPYPTPQEEEDPTENDNHPQTLFESLTSSSSTHSLSPVTPQRKLVQLESQTKPKVKKQKSGYLSFNFDDLGDFEPFHKKIACLKQYYGVKDSPHAQFYREEETQAEPIFSSHLYQSFLVPDPFREASEKHPKIFQVPYEDYDQNDAIFIGWEKMLSIDPHDFLDNPLWLEVLDIIKCALCLRPEELPETPQSTDTADQPAFLKDGVGIYRSICVAFCCKLLEAFSQLQNDQIYDLYEVIINHLLSQFHRVNTSEPSSLSPSYFQFFASKLTTFITDFTPQNETQRLSSCSLDMRLSLVLLRNIIKFFSVISKAGEKNEVFNKIVNKFFTLMYNGKSLQVNFYHNFSLIFFIFFLDNDNISKLTSSESFSASEFVIDEQFLSNSILFQFINLFVQFSSVQLFLYSFYTKILMKFIAEIVFLPKFYNHVVKKVTNIDSKLNFSSYCYILFYNFFYFLSSFLDKESSTNILHLLFHRTNESGNQYDFNLKPIDNTNKLFYTCPNSSSSDQLVNLLFGSENQDFGLPSPKASHQTLSLEIIFECIFSIPLESIHESFFPTFPQFLQNYLVAIYYFSSRVPTLSVIGMEYIIKFLMNLAENEIFLNNYSHFLYSFVHEITTCINKNKTVFSNNFKVLQLFIQLFNQVTEKFKTIHSKTDKDTRGQLEMLFISIINFSDSFNLISDFDPKSSSEFLDSINYVFFFSINILQGDSKIKCSQNLLISILSYLNNYSSFFQEEIVQSMSFNKVFKQLAKFTIKKDSSVVLNNEICRFMTKYFNSFCVSSKIVLNSSFFSQPIEKLLNNCQIFSTQYEDFDNFSSFLLNFMSKSNELSLISIQYSLYFLKCLLGITDKNLTQVQPDISSILSRIQSEYSKDTFIHSFASDILKLSRTVSELIGSVQEDFSLDKYQQKVNILLKNFPTSGTELELIEAILSLFHQNFLIFLDSFPYYLLENTPGSVFFFRQISLYYLHSPAFTTHISLDNNFFAFVKNSSILSYNPHYRFLYSSFLHSSDLFKHKDIDFFQKYSLYIDSFMPISDSISDFDSDLRFSEYFSQKKNFFSSDIDNFSSLVFNNGKFSSQFFHCMSLARNEKELKIIHKHLHLFAQSQDDMKSSVTALVQHFLADSHFREDFPLEVLVSFLLDHWLSQINICDKNRTENSKDPLYSKYTDLPGSAFSNGTPSILCSALFLFDNINSLKTSGPLDYSSLACFISAYLSLFHDHFDFSSTSFEEISLQLGSFGVEWNTFQERLSTFLTV